MSWYIGNYLCLALRTLVWIKNKVIKHISPQMYTFFWHHAAQNIFANQWILILVSNNCRMVFQDANYRFSNPFCHKKYFFCLSNLVFLNCTTLSVSQGKTLFCNYDLVVTTSIQDIFLTDHVLRARPTMLYWFWTWQQRLRQYNLNF